MKHEIFNKELNYINDNRLKENAIIILNELPDYFYEIPASSTGKYHPKYTLGEGGLIRHVKGAVDIANNLFDIYKFDSHTKDIIIISLLIHDGLKHGFNYDKYTKFEHPILIGELLSNIKDKLTLSDDEIKEITDNVASHMGRFNTSNYSDTILPLPKTVTEKFVHMCDFLASRKEILFEFDDTNNIIK